MKEYKNEVHIPAHLDEETTNALHEFSNAYNFTDIGKKMGEWIGKGEEERGEFVINTDLDQPSYEAILDFIGDYPDLPITQELKDWRDYTEWDFAAWYIGDDI